jgi:hypothetical protein
MPLRKLITPWFTHESIAPIQPSPRTPGAAAAELTDWGPAFGRTEVCKAEATVAGSTVGVALQCDTGVSLAPSH